MKIKVASDNQCLNIKQRLYNMYYQVEVNSQMVMIAKVPENRFKPLFSFYWLSIKISWEKKFPNCLLFTKFIKNCLSMHTLTHENSFMLRNENICWYVRISEYSLTMCTQIFSATPPTPYQHRFSRKSSVANNKDYPDPS